MHGLAIFLHDIVGDINQVVNGTDTAGSQPSLHPLGRRGDFDIGTYPCTVAGAQIGILYLYFNIIIDIFPIFMHINHRGDEGLMEGHGRFPGNSQNTEAVNSVVCDFIFKYGVPQTQGIDCVGTYFHIIAENIDAVFRSLGIHIPAGSQLFNRAHHTVGGNSPQLSCFNGNALLRERAAVVSAGHLTAVKNHRHLVPFLHIGSACNDLNGLSSDIYLADDQLVRVRMLFYFFYLANYDFFQIPVKPFIAFHLGAAHCHRIAVFLVRA